MVFAQYFMRYTLKKLLKFSIYKETKLSPYPLKSSAMEENKDAPWLRIFKPSLLPQCQMIMHRS
ncbi:hypothetical protein MA16_Dca000648 [Dendrobium catenatum]|uniref:Uncharacterized protein n=1 Tax=Dendrobium catenatum TaxID=906689 RepID=A0A2I0WUJ5_9ASPA|nr:hypothetical protein MA16_Dca000648 [Dendrobium catenatum]